MWPTEISFDIFSGLIHHLIIFRMEAYICFYQNGANAYLIKINGISRTENNLEN